MLLNNFFAKKIFIIFLLGSPVFSYAFHLQVTIDGQETSEAPGPIQITGDSANLKFTVENGWGSDYGPVTVYNRFADLLITGVYRPVCTIDTIPSGSSGFCYSEFNVGSGQNHGIFIVDEEDPADFKITDTPDKTDVYFYGMPEYPDVDLSVSLNEEATDNSPGPEFLAGENASWRYDITNTNSYDLSNISIVHDFGVGGNEICNIAQLQPGQTDTCFFNDIVLEGEIDSLVHVQGDLFDGLKLDKSIHSYFIGYPELSARPKVFPDSGDAPLTVTFSPEVVTSSAIEKYEWDFNGDGIYDAIDSVGRNFSYTYNEPGEFDASLRVTDTQGEQAVGTVTVMVGNALPEISLAEASPSTGESPLVVTFNISANDADGIVAVNLDVDGDGAYDYPRTIASVTSINETFQHAYEQVGSFIPVVEVVDSLGASRVATFPTLEVRALEAGSPSVTLSLSPETGDVPLDVTLTATANDPDNLAITQWDWDFDGDGQFDQQTTSASIVHTFERAGTFYPRVRVTAEDAQSAEDVAKLVTHAYLELDVSTDTIDVGLGQSVSIDTTLSGPTKVSLQIEKPDGSLVKTLVPWTERQTGNYSDIWNGDDDEGLAVKEGEYRAVMLFELDGQTHRLDLATTSGGTQYNPSRSSIPSTFSPLAGEPLEITFTLNQASEVTAFMGLFNVNTRLVTFHQRQPLGKGSHKIYWSGEDDYGQRIELPSGESFLFGIWGWTLPDNAIYVRSGAHLTSLTVEPRVLVPSSRPDEQSNKISVSTFTLSKAASVNITVDNADTGVKVYEALIPDLEAGEQTVTWDGYNDQGERVSPGIYRIGITPIDGNDFKATTRYILQQVYY